jgi:hypothetical protein
MAKHKSKEFDSIVETMIELEFRIKNNGNTLILFPPIKEYPIRTAHRGDKAVGPLKSYLKKYLDFIGKKI